MNRQRILLRGASVIDGTGSPSRQCDVLVEDDRIAAMGPDLGVPAESDTRDLKGHTITPGFIDLHSHADFTLLAFPGSDSALRQGITTVATGNCGGGVAPIRSKDDVGVNAFAYNPAWGVEVDWSSFGEYAARLDGVGVNVAPLVAHGTVRNAVMGMASRPPSAEELRDMKKVLARSLDEGAFGMSTGLEYQPGIWAEIGEIAALTEEVGARDRLYATHMRGRAEEHSAATEEALTTAGLSGARLQLSHFAPRPNAPRAAADRAFELVDMAVSEGSPVGVDTFPEVWGPALLIDLFPEWSLDGSPGDVSQRLNSGSSRARLRTHFEKTPSFLARVAGYGEIYIADTPGEDDLTGLSLVELARQGRESVADAACEVLLDAGEDYRSVAIRHVYAMEDDLRETIALPYCSFESDGVVTTGEGGDCPLIWNASSYGYVARVIAHYVKSEGFLTLEEAVRRMTSLPAQALNLRGRGSISVGSYADLVVIDTNAISDHSTPVDPARHPTGFELVMVNGQPVVKQDRLIGARSGRLLRP